MGLSMIDRSELGSSVEGGAEEVCSCEVFFAMRAREWRIHAPL
jgi:hypothetical protein